MPGQKEVKKEAKPEEIKLDEANKEVLNYAASEEAEADRILAEATGRQTQKEGPGPGGEKDLKGEKDPKKVEDKINEPAPESGGENEEDLTKNLTVENAEKRISSAQKKMHESNKSAKDAIHEAEQLKKENADLRALVDKEATAATEKKEETLPEAEGVGPEMDEVETSLEALKAEYPEIADPILKVLQASRQENNALKGRIDKLDAREVERESQAKKSVEDAHISAIAEAHPDYAEISREPLLNDWIDGLPAVERAGAQAIQKNGSTSDVIELLTNFKRANGYQLPAEKSETTKANSKVEKARKLATPSFGKAKGVNTETRQIKFTQQQIHEMSDEEFRRREPEIDAAMAEGLVA